MYHTIVTLKKGEGRTIKAGGMWIYDNEIASILGDFENGDLVTVHDFDGYFMDPSSLSPTQAASIPYLAISAAFSGKGRGLPLSSTAT